MALPALDALDLASLMASKICHDVVGPVGACVNALETLDEEDGGDMAEFAMNVVRDSSAVAADKLAFARTAFGATGGATTPIDSGLAEEVAQGLYKHEKAELKWSGPRSMMPKDRAKVLLGLVYQAKEAVPRGGTVDVAIEGEGDAATFTVRGSGPRARIPDAIADLIDGRFDGAISAREVQPWFTLKLAEACAMDVRVKPDGDDVVFTAA